MFPGAHLLSFESFTTISIISKNENLNCVIFWEVYASLLLFLFPNVLKVYIWKLCQEKPEQDPENRNPVYKSKTEVLPLWVRKLIFVMTFFILQHSQKKT